MLMKSSASSPNSTASEGMPNSTRESENRKLSTYQYFAVYESTHELPTSVFNRVVNRIMELKSQKEADDAENGEQGEEASTSDNQ